MLRLLTSLLCFVICSTAAAQLVRTDPAQPIDVLINSNFGNDCAEISNVNSSNNAQLYGLPPSILGFTSTNPSFPFSSGFVLSTGDASSAGNTVIGTNLNDGNNAWVGDADLEMNLGITNTLNASVVEFDVISATDLLSFDYLLASEEYQQNFPCNVSDGFAILIRPTSGGAFTNMAIIPGTSQPVGIGTIHPEVVGQCAAENDDFFAGQNMGATNFEGRTEVLTAVANVIPEVSYRIKMVIADQADFRFDSAVFVQANSLQSEVDLGPDLVPCQNATLNADVGNPRATYKWFKDGVELSGITSSDLFVDVTGTYAVEATIQLSGSTCIIGDTIEIIIDPDQLDITISTQERCDDISLDGREEFDLDVISGAVISDLPLGSYQGIFYNTASDATNEINPLSGSFTNSVNPQTLIYRLKDLNTGCEATIPVQFEVSDVLIASDATVDVCDTDQDGITSLNLATIDDLITTFTPVNSITYHPTGLDAIEATNELSSPYTTVSSNDLIFVRLERTNSNCFSTSEVQINVILPPVLDDDYTFIDACDSDRDGLAVFDLTSALTDFIPSGFGGVITYHTSRTDADENLNPITNPTAFANTTAFSQNIYVRFTDSNTGCASIARLEVFSNYLISETLVEDVTECDDPNMDGIAEFDLKSIEISFLNGLENVDIEFFESEADRDNDVNQLDKTVPFLNSTNPQTIYIRINSLTCTEFSSFDLVVIDFFNVDTIPDQELCVLDPTATSQLDLTALIPALTRIVPATTITFYASQADADDEMNPITRLSSDTNPLEVFATFTNGANCTETRPFGIDLVTAPAANQPTAIEFCETSGTGIGTVDLTVRETEISASSNIEFRYFTSRGEATLDTNPITTPAAYSTDGDVIFVRVQDLTGNCSTVVELVVSVNTQHVFPAISTFLSCEDDNDGRNTFLLIEKDNEILDGATGVTLTYHTSLSDATSGINSIDKESDFTNTSNPQIIYVRAVNDEAPICAITASFDLFVDTAPDYNLPEDVNGCDEEDDEIATIDVQPIIDQVSAGTTGSITVTVHDDFIDAVNDVNPLGATFTNTINPQALFVRVENGNGCFDIEELSVGVVRRPDLVIGVPPSTECDIAGDRQDGSTAFDLTAREFEIAGARQFVTVLTWHENITDAENGTNAIPAAVETAYENTSNPQTVYLRRTNITYGCFRIAPLELIVELPLDLDDDADLIICEPEDGLANLTQIIPLLNNGDLTNFQIDFYESLSDAQIEINPVDTDYAYTSPTTTLFATARDLTTDCRSFEEFELIVIERPNIAPANTYDVTYCDEDYDGLVFIDLFENQDIILNGLDPARYFLEYFATEQDRADNVNSISDLYEVSDGDTFFIMVTDLDLGCESLGQFTVTINLPPVVDLSPLYIICNDGFTTVTVDLFPDETVLWFTGETTQSINIAEEGQYSVVVTSREGCPSPRRVFRTRKSEAPTIEGTLATDFSKPNSVTINVSGVGEYLYFLDNSEPQRDNTFTNVSTGFHEVGATDLYGCGTTTTEVLVIDYPRFFTPNGDGFNDTWQVDNIDQFDSAIFYVYDRHGKLIKQFNQNSAGWNGIFNGQPLPSSDYWFTLEINDAGREFEVKGHFAMKR